ncbi:hypothetical protein PANDA_007460 [Ailuropoda melanoleuca]|uniref:Uncharacterized protein n=1 Tax=Ailuropoda melanoleuca TaxID=9646 RepID=D2HAJ5_AILME|nr:hypothetical protein PANDA_007460 [Ailuropoda melanoleuca]
MLSATRRASLLFHSLFPGSRMGDSASKIVSPQEAVPGRKEPIPVAGVCALSAGFCASPFLSLVYGPLGVLATCSDALDCGLSNPYSWYNSSLDRLLKVLTGPEMGSITSLSQFMKNYVIQQSAHRSKSCWSPEFLANHLAFLAHRDVCTGLKKRRTELLAPPTKDCSGPDNSPSSGGGSP